MLSTTELRAELARVSYRPGWSFEVYDGAWEGQHLVIRAQVLDAADPREHVVLDVHSMLPPCRDLAAFYSWLAWRLGRLEMHEMREWFRVDGVPVFDPHAPGAEHDLP